MLRQLAEGSLNVEVDQKLLGRRDELGGIALALQDLVQKLSTIIKHIQQSSGELMESGQSLDEMAERVNENATEISRAVEEISSGAATQSEEIETASGQIMDMGSVIESIVKDVGQLNDTSKTMKEAGDTSAEIMRAWRRPPTARMKPSRKLARRYMLPTNRRRKSVPLWILFLPLPARLPCCR